MADNSGNPSVLRSRDFVFSITLIVSLAVSLALGGLYYLPDWIRDDVGELIARLPGGSLVRGKAANSAAARPTEQSVAEVYGQLGISPLPRNSKSEEIITRLDQMRREPCYRDGIIGLAKLFTEVGYPREADTSLTSFATRCGESDSLSMQRHQVLMKAGDLQTALKVAEKLVNADPGRATYRYMRGQTYEQLKEFEHALADYINSVQLLGSPSRVAGYHFYDIARMYAALGRYCEAISPVETFVAFDPASRRTQQSMSMILEYSNKGNCRVAHARGNARVTLAASGNVHTLNVVVNGMRGNFILDTGASYLSVTTAFAEKTKINVNTSTKVPIKVVAGTVQAKLSTAATVAVGGAEARNVTVAVIDDSHEPFGPRTDGLLGMSFLARFEVRLTPNGLELTSPQSKDGQEIDQTAPNTNAGRKGRSPR